MQILVWIAYTCWAAAAFIIVVGLSEQAPILMVAGLSSAVTGVLFYAFDRVIELLTDIRDAALASKDRSGALEATHLEPTRTIDDLSADLERIKSGLP